MTLPKYERLGKPSRETYDEEVDNIDSEIKIESNSKRPTHRPKIIHLAIIATLGLIVLYLSLSICLTFYQGWLLKDLKFPLTIVLYHLVVKLVMSTIVRTIYKCSTGKSRVVLDWRTSVKKMAPTGLASGIDIGFSNWGLELVNISLYTMTKSSTIIFILFFAILLGLEKKSWSLVFIVVMIAGGLFMFTYKSTQFDAFGFAFLLFASLASGIRWSLAQLVMQKWKLGLHNPVDMIFHMQPWMILSILPFTLGFEGHKVLEAIQRIPETPTEEIVFLFIKVSIGAMIAFIMEISEFLVLSYTSSLTLSITGIFKDICQLVLAVELNGDQLSLLNILGLILCLGGICCHVIHKYSVFASGKSEEVVFAIDRDQQMNENKTNVKFRKHVGQNIPLLDSNELNHSDSDDSPNGDNRNSSEILHDVLKRRDSGKR